MCTIIQLAIAQDYTPMVVDNATWIYEGFGELENQNFAVRIEGDTIVNNIEYKKVYILRFEEFNPEEEISTQNKELISMLRENENEKKVYMLSWQLLPDEIGFNDCIELNTPNEFLLYNFDLSIGDTLKTCLSKDFFDSSNKLVATKIDYKDQFGYSLKTTNLSLISNLTEGIGFDQGLFFSPYLIFHAAKGYNLSHYCREEQTILCTTNATESLTTLSAKIYPNPSSDLINIEAKYDFDIIEIYNSTGIKIHNQKINFTKNARLNTYDFPNGLLILNLKNSIQKINCISTFLNISHN